MALYLNSSGGSEAYELAQNVALAILARGWQTVARRDFVQVVHQFRKAAQELQDATLRLFVDLGWLRYAEGGYHKAMPARFEVNPGLAAKFAALAERERELRAIRRDAIAQSTQDRNAGVA
jgi:hypothetical protein